MKRDSVHSRLAAVTIAIAILFANVAGFPAHAQNGDCGSTAAQHANSPMAMMMDMSDTAKKAEKTPVSPALPCKDMGFGCIAGAGCGVPNMLGYADVVVLTPSSSFNVTWIVQVDTSSMAYKPALPPPISA